MKRSYIIFAALLILIILAFIFLFKSNNTNKETKTAEPKKVATTQQKTEVGIEVLPSKLENLELPKVIGGDMFIKKKGLTLVYSEAYEQPVWVAYTLTPEKLIKRANRADSFKADREVTTGTATNKDYSRSGYDKGHMAPAADMAYSPAVMNESFLFSNVSPQKPQFNRGIWKDLEEDTRSWCRQFGELYITTGPIFTKIIERIGPNKVAVPASYFKAILVYSQNQYWAIGFIMPNEGTNKPISSFIVPIDSIEKVSGLDLYHNLPDSIEAEVESARRLPRWLLN